MKACSKTGHDMARTHTDEARQVTDEMVERAARYLYMAYVLRDPMLPAEYARYFDCLGETTKSRWRQLARETLQAGLGGGDGTDN